MEPLRLFALCGPDQPPSPLHRKPSSASEPPHFSLTLPDPLPSVLVVFALGDWSLCPGGAEAQVIGASGKSTRLGILSEQTRCLLWEGDPSKPPGGAAGSWGYQLQVRGQEVSRPECPPADKRRRHFQEKEEGGEENTCPNVRPAPRLRGRCRKPPVSRPRKCSTDVEASAPSARWGHTLCPVKEGMAVLIGGQGAHLQFCKDAMWKLNTMDESWAPAETLTAGPRPESRTGHTATFDPNTGRVYVFGGSKNRKWFNDVHILDTKTWGWATVEAQGKVPPLSYHSSWLFRGELFVFGGVTPRPHPEPDGCSDGLYVFDPQERIWYRPIVLGQPPCPRSGHSACLLQKKVYVFGGWDTPLCFKDLFLLDLGLMEFSEVKTAGTGPSPRCWHAAAPVSNRGFLLHGGYDGERALGDTFFFDSENEVWTILSSSGLGCLPRAGHTLLPLPGRGPGMEEEAEEELLLFGGGDNEGTFYSDTKRLPLSALSLP
ncbi:rab9 effector protein with kelch motifs-like isoform X1 [Tachyglossus aculeatus]|uniref:rab9 effector protein with kelch motifs-like isoform X1 n=1 Tax=Tachyglossus aculeatus TaxID=9261 RepID=UPI0018F2A8E6|nr:rab9 effector protein with kelch motifs-like isoform X1 [Tachyglossus aculeatus]